MLASEAAPGYEVLKCPTSYPHMASTWLRLGPEVLYWAPRHVAKLWKLKDIYITRERHLEQRTSRPRTAWSTTSIA